jgi:hypothetical protein
MSFLSPAPPPFELEEWKAKPHLTRLKPLVQDWGVSGFGSPTFVYFLYAIKLVVYVAGALLVISLTPGLGGVGDIGDWWTEPIVFQKLAAWTLLWRSWVWARARCRSASASCLRLAAPCTGCGPGRCASRPGPTRSR